MNTWMRWVDFRALRDLLLLVESRVGGLRAGELQKLATIEGVLLRRDGQPYKASTHYHHRRTLERLGLLVKRGRLLTLNSDLDSVRTLTSRKALGGPLQPCERDAFATSLLRNKDCHEVFFSAFLPSQVPVCDVRGFVETAAPVEMNVMNSGHVPTERRSGVSASVATDSPGVSLRPIGADNWRVLGGVNAVQAVHFGLKSWCANQLGFMDVAHSASGTYTLYPTHIVAPVSNQELGARMFDALSLKAIGRRCGSRTVRYRQALPKGCRWNKQSRY